MSSEVPIPIQEDKIDRNPDGTFKVGISGNPAGRGKGTFSIMTLIRKKMEEIPPGQVKQWKEQIAEIILEEAVVKKNPKMIEMIVEYMDGKPKQSVDLDVNRENVDSLTDLLRIISSKPKDGSEPITPEPTGSGS